jgi:hypothetical protein
MDDLVYIMEVVAFYQDPSKCPNPRFHAAMKKIQFQLDLALESIKPEPDAPERSDFAEHNTMSYVHTGVKK